MLSINKRHATPWTWLAIMKLETEIRRGRLLQEETRSELFWGETGLKIRPDVFRHDNCERISYLF
jgi:hypothetical protein